MFFAPFCCDFTKKSRLFYNKVIKIDPVQARKPDQDLILCLWDPIAAYYFKLCNQLDFLSVIYGDSIIHFFVKRLLNLAISVNFSRIFLDETWSCHLMMAYCMRFWSISISNQAEKDRSYIALTFGSSCESMWRSPGSIY